MSQLEESLDSLKNICSLYVNDIIEILSDSFGIETTSTMYFIIFGLSILILAISYNIYQLIGRRTNQSIRDRDVDGNLHQSDDNSTIAKDQQQQNQKEINENQLLNNGDVVQRPRKSSELFSVKKPINGSEGEHHDGEGDGDTNVTWMNDVMQWFYDNCCSNEQFVNEICNNWLNALNDKSQHLIVENGVFVEFVSVEQCLTPKLSQFEIVDEINENVITTMKSTCDRLIMQVRVSPDSISEPNRSAIYNVILEKFSALLKVVGITKDSLFVIRMLERPETKAQIEGPLLGSKNKFMPDDIINGVMNVFTSTIFDLNFGKSRNFPKAKIKEVEESIGKKTTAVTKNQSSPSKSNVQRKLLLKIVKAYDLDLNETDGHQIYCMVEIDEPFQSTKTSLVRENVQTPIWEQHFMLNLNDRSEEILFELKDMQPNKKDAAQSQILGNAIVNISELISNPSQTQTLRLQSSMDNQKDFGFLVAEFLVMEHNSAQSIQPDKSPIIQERKIISRQSSQQSSQPDASPFSTCNINGQCNDQNNYDNGSHCSERTLTSSNFIEDYCDLDTKRDSLIASAGDAWEHQSKASSFLNTLDKECDDFDLTSNTGCNHSYNVANDNSGSTSTLTDQPQSCLNHQANQNPATDQSHDQNQNDNYGDNYTSWQPLDDSKSIKPEKEKIRIERNPSFQEENGHRNKTVGDENAIQSIDQITDDKKRSFTLDQRHSDSGTTMRSNTKDSSKSLIRNLKKRFSFNRRSKSVERSFPNRQGSLSNSNNNNNNDYEEDDNLGPLGKAMERARSVPGSREPSIPKDVLMNNGHQQSYGNLSQASTKTFLHDDSIVIMECLENGNLKHYVVANDSLKKDEKLKRKAGNKLHLFKDHLFVARHVPSSRLCHVCDKKFPFRFGKQAYQCRDCSLCCHKPCHVNVEKRCHKSSIAALNLAMTEGEIDEPNRRLTNPVPELKITDADDSSIH